MKKLLMIASTESHFKQFHQAYFPPLSKDYDVHLAYPHPQEVFSGVKEQIHLPLTKEYFHVKNIQSVVQLRRRIKQEQYDRIITHTALASFWTRLSLWGMKKRPFVICVVHGYLFHDHSHPVKGRILLGAEQIVKKQTDCILTMNQWDEAMAKKYRLAPLVYGINGMGVEKPQVKDLAQNITDTLQALPQEAFVLLYGGEFSKRKNQGFLIQAMAEAPPQVHLLLAGEGDLLPQCKALAKNLGLEQRVHFLGQVANLPSLYAQGDLVVSSSISEGLPFHLMEAMALGKAILASGVKGHEDLLAQHGFLYEPENKEDFLEQVRRCIKEKDKLPQQGQELQNRWEQHYALSQVLPQVLDYYEGR
ncbi:MAG: glycosyltransferase [Eubacteriales bacterium]